MAGKKIQNSRLGKPPMMSHYICMCVVCQAIIRSELQTLLAAKTTQQKGLQQTDEILAKTARQKLYVSS